MRVLKGSAVPRLVATRRTLDTADYSDRCAGALLGAETALASLAVPALASLGVALAAGAGSDRQMALRLELVLVEAGRRGLTHYRVLPNGVILVGVPVTP